MFCTLGDINEYTGGVQYTGGCHEYRRDTMNTTGRYHEYSGGTP